MAATIFALRNLCLILLLCSGFLSLFHHVGTARERALQPAFCWIPRLHFICRRDFPSYNPSRPIVSWNKGGFMCLSLPASDQTIFMNVERNPGPCWSLWFLVNTAHFDTSSYNVRGLDLGHQKHHRPSCISYERNRLLSLRHWSNHYCSPEFLGELKSMDLLRYRGKRAGGLNKQKSTGNGLRIPVICSGRRHYRVSLNIQNATSTLQICESRPLGVNVNNLIYIRSDPLRSKLSTVVPLDFCLLNARSICNKSRLINDFTYCTSCAATDFSIN